MRWLASRPKDSSRDTAKASRCLNEKPYDLDKALYVLKEEIVQANFSISYPGVVRAWHRHLRGQEDCFVVLKGAMKICVYEEEAGEIDEIVMAGDNLHVVKVPGYYWHGFKVLGNERAYLVYFINGRTDDERCNNPWDWFFPPYK